jgi:hypothetical protein
MYLKSLNFSENVLIKSKSLKRLKFSKYIFETLRILQKKVPRLGTGRLKNEIGHVTHQASVDRKFCIDEEIYTFRGQNGKNRSPEPKNGSWGPKSIWSCDISIDREFHMEQEKIYFWGSKTEFGAQKRNLGPKISMIV